jgi:hypothetical protein
MDTWGNGGGEGAHTQLPARKQDLQHRDCTSGDPRPNTRKHWMHAVTVSSGEKARVSHMGGGSLCCGEKARVSHMVGGSLCCSWWGGVQKRMMLGWGPCGRVHIPHPLITTQSLPAECVGGGGRREGGVGWGGGAQDNLPPPSAPHAPCPMPPATPTALATPPPRPRQRAHRRRCHCPHWHHHRQQNLYSDRKDRE